MAEQIQIPNFDSINLVESALLDADADLGQPTVTLLSLQGISASDKIYLGPLAAETSEIATVLSTAGKNVTFTTNLVNEHRRFESITKLFGDQIKVYRAANVDGTIPSDASFSQIGSAVDIDPDQTFTLFTDGSGGSGYWYKTTYFNSVTLAETNLAQSFASRGGGYGHLVAVEAVRLEAGLQNATHLDDSLIAERRDQAEDEVLGRLAAAGYVIPLQASNGTLFVPPMVENITRLLAAGYLMIQEYGELAEEDPKSGKSKIKQAYDMLRDIQEQKVILVDVVGVSLAHTSQVSGWPDNTTELVGTDGRPEPFQMRMSKRF
jgi:hypothetical protein